MSYNVDEDRDEVDNGNFLIVMILMTAFSGAMGCALGMAISQLLF